ncbi:MAG TPA: NAD(P)/FAD-dependent oxidoreductase [Streptosporangiaceae bacterium]|nr:NAD(P)/FAD-dependent oxidoreductase [Streptosporangiaceae bacterium]
MRSKSRDTERPEVLIIGGGFAGLTAMHALARTAAAVTLVDRNVYSTFQPLLYEVATAGLTAADVAYPLWSATFRRGAQYRKGELASLDLERRIATLDTGEKLSYDFLIIATGVSAAFFGVPGAAEHALSLYTRRDAVRLRNSLMDALERRNEGLAGPEIDITVVGGGATGVELAGTLAELRNFALPAVYPNIDRSMFQVRLIEMGPALLAPYHRRLRDYTRQQLVDRGVEVVLGTAIKEVRDGSVLLADGSERRSDITVWAAGVAGPDAEWTRALPRGKGGRIEVGADLRVTGQERLFAAGDIAVNSAAPVPQLAQPALQEGKHAGEQVARLLRGLPTQPFSYHDKGIMATIGRRSAVVELHNGLRLRGTVAWLAWLGLHLIYLLGNRNRVVTLFNLAWRYLTWSRGGGIIVGDDVPGQE